MYGALHVSLASAGVAWPCPTLTKDIELNTEMFREVMEINLFGTIYLAKYAAIQMNKQKSIDGEKGVIINVGSLAAFEA